MKLNINEMRKAAGLNETSDASPKHIKNERALFEKCIKCCEEIIAMAEGRLKEKDLTDEHKKQYREMCDDAKKQIEVMKSHLTSYEKAE